MSKSKTATATCHTQCAGPNTGTTFEYTNTDVHRGHFQPGPDRDTGHSYPASKEESLLVACPTCKSEVPVNEIPAP